MNAVSSKEYSTTIVVAPTPTDYRGPTPIRHVLHGGSADLEVLRLRQNLGDAVLPGVEAVGAGYNLYGDFASAKAILTQIFDWSKGSSKPVSFKPAYTVPEIIDVQQQDGYVYVNTSGESISEYQQNFSGKVTISGAYNLFAGSVSNEFTSSSLRKAENEFSRIQQTITLWSLVVRPDYDALRALLYDYVRKALDTAQGDADYENIFNRFGSHFLSGIIMGGRATLSSATDKVTVNRAFSNETIAQATYQGLTGQLTAEAQAKYAESIESFEANSDMRHYVRGGDGTLAADVFSGEKEDFDKWVASVGESPDFVDFMQTNALTGIWCLCTDSAQQGKLQEYFLNVWGPAKSKAAEIAADYIDALAIVYGDNSGVQPPSGYVKINYDLNKGAGGKFIYLCYHKSAVDTINEKANPNCIDDILFVIGEGAPPPPGYTKIDVDLNKGAKGAYIYLCYHSVAYDGIKAIKDVAIIGGDNADIPPPYAFTKVNQDLNQGAGGDFIYLCFSQTA